MSTFPPDQQPKVIFPKRERSWFSRNALWFIPLMIFLVGTPVLCAGSLILFGRTAMHIVLGPRDAAIEAMGAQPEVTAKMGSPIEVSNSHVNFNDMQIKNDSGSVHIEFDAKGPKQGAEVDAKMLMRNNDWEIGHLIIKYDDGETFEMGDRSLRSAEVEEDAFAAELEPESD